MVRAWTALSTRHQDIEQDVDVYSFLFNRLRAPPPPWPPPVPPRP